MKNHSPNSKLPAARTAGTMGLQRTEGAPCQVQFLKVPGRKVLAASQPKEADGSSILNEKRTWEIVLPDLTIDAK